MHLCSLLFVHGYAAQCLAHISLVDQLQIYIIIVITGCQEYTGFKRNTRFQEEKLPTPCKTLQLCTLHQHACSHGAGSSCLAVAPQTCLLDFAPAHAASYNALVEVIRRNLLLADWCDDAHYEVSGWGRMMVCYVTLCDDAHYGLRGWAYTGVLRYTCQQVSPLLNFL